MQRWMREGEGMSSGEEERDSMGGGGDVLPAGGVGRSVGPSEEEGAHTLAQEHRAGSCRNGMPPYGTSRVERNK